MLSDFELIDLTHELDSAVPTWDGSCGYRQEIVSDYADGCRVQKVTMQAGIGTHMDAPSHFIPNGACIHELKIEKFIVPACVLDVSDKADQDYLISIKDIENFEKKFGKIPKTSLFIANTGWSKYWKKPNQYRNVGSDGKMHFPSFSKDAAELLLERQVSGIGSDTLSPDCQDLAFPVHHVILGAGKYIIENLTALDKMPPVGAYVIALPIKAKDATEAPLRVLGLLPRKASSFASAS
jgi:kynurenine formamidase